MPLTVLHGCGHTLGGARSVVHRWGGSEELARRRTPQGLARGLARVAAVAEEDATSLAANGGGGGALSKLLTQPSVF